MTSPRERPAIDLSDAGEWDAVVIRTDYSDDAGWQRIAVGLRQPWGEDVSEPPCHLVDDPGWAGADADEVLAALPADPHETLHDVVFLADGPSMRGEHPLPAVSTDPDMEDRDDEFPGPGSTCRFRISPTAVAEMVGNLAIANMDYEDFSSSAHDDAQRIHRGFL
ncbi:hypothetical protein NX794_20985 [Streptomyces sp. LP11]|uniref:DUF6924 domain-containing protein n=1 Tax=Streptomyces pyxinicus TaxID=2970331 RepID=A0ABT2B579_9ACTN|nr:hypothetical protein [Streptomyces sp. LP11]MCS0603670.1 hypothetical protein [Streptomyces sp. LP11]